MEWIDLGGSCEYVTSKCYVHVALRKAAEKLQTVIGSMIVWYRSSYNS